MIRIYGVLVAGSASFSNKINASSKLQLLNVTIFVAYLTLDKFSLNLI